MRTKSSHAFAVAGERDRVLATPGTAVATRRTQRMGAAVIEGIARTGRFMPSGRALGWPIDVTVEKTGDSEGDWRGRRYRF